MKTLVLILSMTTLIESKLLKIALSIKVWEALTLKMMKAVAMRMITRARVNNLVLVTTHQMTMIMVVKDDITISVHKKT